MPMKFSKTRVVNSDINRYTKMNTGTSGNPKNYGKSIGVQRNDPQFTSSRLTSTRVKSGGVVNHNAQAGERGSTKMKKTRVTK
jgi:hypothetical protein